MPAGGRRCASPMRRARPCEFRFVWEGKTFNIGVSIGLVPINAETRHQQVLAAADACCYEAKKRGRDRVQVYRPENRSGETPRRATARVRNQPCVRAAPVPLYRQRIAPLGPRPAARAASPAIDALRGNPPAAHCRCRNFHQGAHDQRSIESAVVAQPRHEPGRRSGCRAVPACVSAPRNGLAPRAGAQRAMRWR